MNNIALIRKNAGLTQEQLGEMIGVKRAVVSKYESGAIDPPTSQILKIAQALNVKVSDLIEEYDVKGAPRLLPPVVYQAFFQRLISELSNSDPADVEAVFGVNPIDDLEAKKTIPLEYADLIANDLGVSLEYLLGIEDQSCEQLSVQEIQKVTERAKEIQNRQYIDVARIILQKGIVHRFFKALDMLNEHGQKEAIKRIEELTMLPQYQAEKETD